MNGYSSIFESIELVRRLESPDKIKKECDLLVSRLYKMFSDGSISASHHELFMKMICTEENRSISYLDRISCEDVSQEFSNSSFLIRNMSSE